MTYLCEACGVDLTPTAAQLAAVRRFGNPLRREPCLQTEDGLHRVSDEQIWEVARTIYGAPFGNGAEAADAAHAAERTLHAVPPSSVPHSQPGGET